MTPEINNSDWDKLQLARGASFLQSAAWGDFQQSLGHTQIRLHGHGWSCLLLQRKARLGNYYFAPYGPTLDNLSSLDEAVKAIKAATTHKAAWVRLEPIIKTGQANLAADLPKAGARPAPRDVEPPMTRIINITPTEEDLLASLSPKTRTRIRRHQREASLEFETSVDPASIHLFTNMLASVSSRSGAHFFPSAYFEKQAAVLMPLGFMRLELAYYAGQPLGAVVIHDYGDTAYYTYAASLPEARSKDVSELLVWQAILSAKARGLKYFDLFGIAPPDASPSHPWHGFSSFKEKFGGQVVEYVGTWDIPIASKYWLYRGLYRLRSLVKN